MIFQNALGVFKRFLFETPHAVDLTPALRELLGITSDNLEISTKAGFGKISLIYLTPAVDRERGIA